MEAPFLGWFLYPWGLDAEVEAKDSEQGRSEPFSTVPQTQSLSGQSREGACLHGFPSLGTNPANQGEWGLARTFPLF